MPVAVRPVTPRRPGRYPPPDPIDQLPLAPLRRPTRLLTLGQQRLQHRPLPVGQVEPPRHRYPGHEVSVLMAVLVDNPSTGDLATYRSPTRRRQITTPLLKQGLGPGRTPRSTDPRPPGQTPGTGGPPRSSRTCASFCARPAA